MKKHIKTTILSAILLICIAIFTVALLLWNGIILINDPSDERFIDMYVFHGSREEFENFGKH